MSTAHAKYYDPATGKYVPVTGAGGGGGPSYGGPEGTEEVGAYKTTIGDGVASQFTVHHGFGTKDVSITIYGLDPAGTDAQPGINRSTEDEIVINFGNFVPPPDSVRVIVAGIV